MTSRTVSQGGAFLDWIIRLPDDRRGPYILLLYFLFSILLYLFISL